MFNDYQKSQLLNDLCILTKHHQEKCLPYKNILNFLDYDFESLERLPYLSVRIFKSLELKSSDNIIKTLTSSGTTGQIPSKIFVDSETAALQTKALASVVSSFIGPVRLPMIIVDKELNRKDIISASDAGVIGFLKFGRDHLYLLDSSGNVKWKELEAFAKKYKEILIFGFTFRIWQWVLECSGKYNFNGYLIHGGGWKKLIDQKVDNDIFKKTIKEKLGNIKVADYYGMVEQIGSICIECEQGYLHVPNFSEIIIRDPITLKAVENGKAGLLQSLSILPKSYPGHSILTEDLATKYGDSCLCGKVGSYFRIHGRLPKSEVRGCSNTK